MVHLERWSAANAAQSRHAASQTGIQLHGCSSGAQQQNTVATTVSAKQEAAHLHQEVTLLRVIPALIHQLPLLGVDQAAAAGAPLAQCCPRPMFHVQVPMLCKRSDPVKGMSCVEVTWAPWVHAALRGMSPCIAHHRHASLCIKHWRAVTEHRIHPQTYATAAPWHMLAANRQLTNHQLPHWWLADEALYLCVDDGHTLGPAALNKLQYSGQHLSGHLPECLLHVDHLRLWVHAQASRYAGLPS